MTRQEVTKILKEHALWLETNGKEGYRANFSRANLSRANLVEANLSYTDLSYTDLSRADLSEAYLPKAYFSYVNLSGVIIDKTLALWLQMNNYDLKVLKVVVK